MLAVNTTVSSNTIDTAPRSSSRRSSSTATPSRKTRPAVGVVEAAREERERRLARAARADERDRGAAVDDEVEVGEQRPARRRVAEA